MLGHKINFESDVCNVLGLPRGSLRDKRRYPNFCSDECPDALSVTSISDWMGDGLALPKLRCSDGNKIESLQDCVLGEKKARTPKIILILESPHKNEFAHRRCREKSNCDSACNPLPAPAQGLTGENIKHYLPLIFNDSTLSEYYVALINSIQYQCSLGDLKLGVKDVIFQALLASADKYYEDSFKKRFIRVYNPAKDIVINCCTNDGGQGSGKDIVRNILDSLVRRDTSIARRFHILEMSHPSCWHFSCANRCVKIHNYESVYKNNLENKYCEKDNYCGLISAIKMIKD